MLCSRPFSLPSRNSLFQWSQESTRDLMWAYTIDLTCQAYCCRLPVHACGLYLGVVISVLKPCVSGNHSESIDSILTCVRELTALRQMMINEMWRPMRKFFSHHFPGEILLRYFHRVSMKLYILIFTFPFSSILLFLKFTFNKV